VVVNHGERIYDGTTDRLFDRYQTKKRITVTFAEDAPADVPPCCEVTERDAHKLCLTLPKDQTESVARELMRYAVSDITIEEDDIGSVVERIYGDRGGAGA